MERQPVERRSSTLLPRLVGIVGVALLAPLGLGLGVDYLSGRAPLFLYIGAIVGIMAGTVAIVRITTRQIEALTEPGAPVERAAQGPDEKGDLLNFSGDRSLWPVSDRATGVARSETGHSRPRLLRRYEKGDSA